jgi:hypothetical protein
MPASARLGGDSRSLEDPRSVLVPPVAGAITQVTVSCWADESTRTPNSACAWVAETMVEARVYVARSRHGAVNKMARQLVAAGLADGPMVVHYRGCLGTMTYRSFHAAATWTFSEGDQPLRRVRYREQPEGLFPVCGTRQKCVSSAGDDVLEPPPVDEPETQAAETRFCDGCDGEFLPARPWSRFCSSACRLRAHRLLARQPSRP